MANTITGGTPVTPITGDKTLAELVARWRLRLDDSTEPYLWSNQELTDYMNTVINVMCREIPLIEDSSTASVCTHAISIGTTTLTLSDRIVYLLRAKLASDTRPLPMTDVEYMDYTFSDWEDAAVNDVQYLIVRGLGNRIVRLYPPSSTTDTLKLTVVRLPIYDMTYATDFAATPEIPGRYLDKLDNGVLYHAYLKQDADTLDHKKAKQHYELWRRDLEEVKRAVLRYSSHPEIAEPQVAFS